MANLGEQTKWIVLVRRRTIMFKCQKVLSSKFENILLRCIFFTGVNLYVWQLFPNEAWQFVDAYKGCWICY